MNFWLGFACGAVLTAVALFALGMLLGPAAR